MKRVLAVLLVVALAAMALVPAAVYAKGNDDHDRGHHNGDRGDKYAIVIGISDYPGDGTVLDYPDPGLDLFYADDDALVVKDTLVKSFKFKKKNVTTLVNTAATKAAILDAIMELEEDVEDNDQVVFFFAGHVLRPDQFGEDPVPGMAGMLVQDDMIWDYELEAAFAGIETDDVTFIFDACSTASFAELAVDGRTVISATDEDGISGEIGDAYAFMWEGADVPPEFAPVLSANHGLFTYFFFVVGIQQGMADFDGDRDVTFYEAFQLAQPMLAGMTAFAQSLGFPMDEVPVYLGSHDD